MGNRKGKKAKLNLHTSRKKCINLLEYNRCRKYDLPFPTKSENANIIIPSSNDTVYMHHEENFTQHPVERIESDDELPRNIIADNNNTLLLHHQLCSNDESLSDCPESESNVLRPESKNKNTEFELIGNRIINVQHFFCGIQNFEHCGIFSCTVQDLEVVNEQIMGFKSKFFLKCKVCMKTSSIHTHNEKDNEMDINQALTLGTISAGSGYAQLQEIFSFSNVPCMSEHTFSKCQEKVAPFVRQAAYQLMEDAGKEERELAIEAGDIDTDGIPYITVVADGAWSKRSYKVNYNASSGVGVIIGQRTGKILFLSIRNKYCYVCTRAANKGQDPQEHVCFKNWNKASTAMESDIILEGFKQSMSTHGLKYLYLIGDGDSSISKKLLECRPYGHKIVNKIECRNHLLRNYCTKLRELTKRCVSSARNTVPIKQRNHLNNNIRRLRSAIACAVQYRRNNSSNNHQEDVKQLKMDIENSINHVFGDHKVCDKYYCKADKKNDYNWIPEMKESGLYQDINIHLGRLSRNAGSLILNMDNNAAERYNSIVAKFTGGKRINFSSRGSYEMRCQAASVSYNSSGGQYSHYLYKTITNVSPGKYLKQYVNKKKVRHEWLKKSIAENPEKFKKRKNFSLAPADADYGAAINEEPMSKEQYKKIADEYVENLHLTSEQIDNIQIQTQLQSDDPTCKWKEERSKRLTASHFGKVCKMKSTTHCANMIKNMLYKEFSGNIHTQWGKDHESVAIEEIQKLLNIQVSKCGLFVDKTEPYLAASPDGLLNDNGIIEIKCPSNSRDLTPFEGIHQKKIKFADIVENKLQLKRNHEYYFQVQGQLHVTSREYCLFVVWTSKGMDVEKIYRDNIFWKNQMEQKLKMFYFKCLLPEIIEPQCPKGLPIKDFRNSATQINTE